MGKISVLHMPIILHLVVFSYYIMDRKMILKSDLTELQQSNIRRYKLQNDGIVKTFCGRNFYKVWNTFQIIKVLEYA